MTSNSDDLKRFKDPLLADLDQFKADRQRSRPKQATEKQPTRGNGVFILGLLLLVSLGILGYYLYQAQARIENLSNDLSTNQEQLETVSSNLEQSRNQIETLNDGLNDSKQQLQSQHGELNRYKGLYQNMKSEQEVQTRELQAINVQKANQSEVNDLKGQTSALEQKLDETGTQVAAVKGDVSRLDSRTQEHQVSISKNREEIAGVSRAANQNATDIGDIRRSLEREYYNFELQEGSGYMKVFDIALSLKDTDATRRQFDIYVMADNKVIRKKDQPINEPILFYLEGKTKPYEVVVTRVDKKMVVGYLSVPKS